MRKIVSIIMAVIMINVISMMAEPPLHNGYGYELTSIYVEREADHDITASWIISSDIDSTLTLYVENVSSETLTGHVTAKNRETARGHSNWYIVDPGKCSLSGKFYTPQPQIPGGTLIIYTPHYSWDANVKITYPRSNFHAHYYWVHRTSSNNN